MSMKTVQRSIRPATLAALAALCLCAASAPVLAQTFSSGSTGANGDLSPAVSTVVTLPPDGVLNYTTITIPAGVTVTFQRNAANTPVTLLATGDVTINGSINVNGSAGVNGVNGGLNVTAGGLGGPGGSRGGNGQLSGGVNLTSGLGQDGGVTNTQGGTYGGTAAFVSLIPLVGGSGGAGSNSNANPGNGPSGGGGGGAILIAASSKIVIAGSVQAIGGAGGIATGGGNPAGNGSGGAIRLVAPLVTSSGSVQAIGGTNPNGTGASGKIRIEAFTTSLSGTMTPVLGSGTTIANAPGPVSPASNPALIAVPTLRIASIGGVTTPADPQASYALGDISLPQGTVNPVPVVVAATNMPTSAAVKVRLFPQSGTATTTGVLTATGTFQSSTVTAGITFPLGTVSLVQAWATMTLTGQIASLFPLIDGEPVESVAMASPLDDGKPVLNLVTKSGREKRFDELTSADQSKVVMAWQALAANR
jgi:hypothetical protein